MHDKILAATKRNLVKRKFPFIQALDHQGPAVVHAMRDITVGVFEHLEITYTMDVNKILDIRSTSLGYQRLINIRRS